MVDYIVDFKEETLREKEGSKEKKRQMEKVVAPPFQSTSTWGEKQCWASTAGANGTCWSQKKSCINRILIIGGLMLRTGWLVGVAVSTTDSESVDGGSIPPRACNNTINILFRTKTPFLLLSGPLGTGMQAWWTQKNGDGPSAG